ncbi:hypothetical protein DVH24_016983 [Malus domestica]|uniref:Uncharacterized protein n=1 Tax=Malus domestica TaxID=3750 RepID=A0A498IRP2_MALDO|nr:hypothetical protein DVH24_016983 [Malus domestica]
MERIYCCLQFIKSQPNGHVYGQRGHDHRRDEVVAAPGAPTPSSPMAMALDLLSSFCLIMIIDVSYN